MPKLQTPKQAVAAMLKRLPATADFREIQYRIYALEKIQRGLEDEAAGRLIPHKEVERRVNEWLSQLSGRRKRRAS
jgi:predicted transcriptional regulator